MQYGHVYGVLRVLSPLTIQLQTCDKLSNIYDWETKLGITQVSELFKSTINHAIHVFKKRVQTPRRRTFESRRPGLTLLRRETNLSTNIAYKCLGMGGIILTEFLFEHVFNAEKPT